MQTKNYVKLLKMRDKQGGIKDTFGNYQACKVKEAKSSFLGGYGIRMSNPGVSQ